MVIIVVGFYIVGSGDTSGGRTLDTCIAGSIQNVSDYFPLPNSIWGQNSVQGGTLTDLLIGGEGIPLFGEGENSLFPPPPL